MGDLIALLPAIGSLITALGATFALVYNTIRTSRRERRRAADTASTATTDSVLEAMRTATEDGVITAEELKEIINRLASEPEEGES
ncbi:hypothetical protein [Crossiella sp. CA198]|uniref:hypothetical protein n=1 Tax=Crossiella sp. CA198 TaxID=3455607 RepID=UPI003F8D68DC